MSSEAVVAACRARAEQLQPLTNCLADTRWEEALQEARQADSLLAGLEAAERARLSQVRPLLGLPFSTKEGIAVRGCRHSYGLPGRAGARADRFALVSIVADVFPHCRDATAVALLRAAGAIPVCVTNVAEAGAWWESNNTVVIQYS